MIGNDPQKPKTASVGSTSGLNSLESQPRQGQRPVNNEANTTMLNHVDLCVTETHKNSIEWCLSLGLAPLPVAPGNKCPSTAKGAFDQTQYIDKQPTKEKLEQWFSNSYGIGAVIKNDVYCLDLDAKNFSISENLEEIVEEYIFKPYPELKQCFDRTRSGGFHIWLKCNQPTPFYTFKIKGFDNKAGELLGRGKFCVLPPTEGYKSIERGNLPVFKSLSELGCIEPYKAVKEKPLANQLTILLTGVDIAKLISGSNQSILVGQHEGDRSDALTTLIKEVWGWENWLSLNGVPVTRSTESIIAEAKTALDAEDKGDRVELSIGSTRSDLMPALYDSSGDKGCWGKVRRVSPEMFDRHCNSEEIKAAVEQGETLKTFPQIAYEELYASGHWITVNDVMHRWNGTHYEAVSDDEEKRRIAQFCDSYKVRIEDKKNPGKARYATKYAQTGAVKQVIEWAKDRTRIDSDLINPDGLNCANGLLMLDYSPQDKKFIRRFVSHDPSYYFTYCSEAIYSPKAETGDLEKLLNCLEPDHQQILLRVLAGSLAIDTVRKYRGRTVRSLLLQGSGSNGKDTWREAIYRLYGGQGVVSAAFSDFRQYDQGRKFPLAKLLGAKVNWASENSGNFSIDNLQSLKQAITGENLECERKGRDGFEFKPKCVHLFNINDIPDMKAAQEAIATRFAVVPFNKTFKANPDTEQGEMEADPRFKDDLDFIRLNILPALLNRLLDELDLLMGEGIDYSAVESKLEEIRKASSHLYEFCLEYRIVYRKGLKLHAATAFEMLKDFYRGDGTYDPDENKFHDQTKWNDSTVKAPNQILDRLIKDVFPKGVKKKDGKGVYLANVGIDATPIKAEEPITQVEGTQERDIEGWHPRYNEMPF